MCYLNIKNKNHSFGKERVFTIVLAAMGMSNFLLPYYIQYFAGALLYAFVIGVSTGCLVALVLPLSMTALKPVKGQTMKEAGREAMDGALRSSTALRLSVMDAMADEEAKEAAAADWPPSSSITSGLVYSTIALGVFTGPAIVG
jgi:hypothetical protein